MAAELPREVVKSQIDHDEIPVVQTKKRKKVRKVAPLTGEDSQNPARALYVYRVRVNLIF